MDFLNFAPFYTQQPNAEVWSKQRQIWCDIILDSFKKSRQTRLDLNEAKLKKIQLFHNSSINRSLSIDMMRLLIEELVQQGNAEWEDPSTKNRCIIFWRKPEEWAALIYQWACDIGFTNTVCTIYELINGENTESQEFHSLDEIVMIRALQCLQTQHHAELFEGNIGVKFL